MKLITKQQEMQLRRNAEINAEKIADEGDSVDLMPVVKIFGGACTWLITELDEDNILFGLADLGMGCPEMGAIATISEMQNVRVGGIFPLERDKFFQAEKTLSQYAAQARDLGYIKA